MTMTIVTPSHAPDFPSFARLHASVARNTDADVRHIVAVPDVDVALFESIGSSRLEVRGYRSILPRRFVSTTRLARLPGLPRGYRVGAVNVRRPFPPIRGWMLQQVVKLALTGELDADVAVLIDSDVIVVRPLEERSFRDASGVVRLYRRPNEIDESRPRPYRWLRTSRELLGVAHAEPDGPDYISAFASWDPRLVRACLARVEQTTGRDWHDVVGSRLDFSEFLLYGTYAMCCAPERARGNVSDDSLCHSHWDPVPLDADRARAFLAGLPAHALAVHVQSNSGTSDEVLADIAGRFTPGM